MKNPAIEYYECTNPSCRLRFPVYAGQLKTKRCPLCRSGLVLVTSVTSSNDINPTNPTLGGWQVEGLLDNIRSAWNVGSIFRTADGTGISKLYLCGVTPTPDNDKVRKTALGAEKTVVWEKANNSLDLAEKLRSSGHLLWALEDTPNAKPLFEINYGNVAAPVVLIVGNEICGVDPGLLALCDQVLSIPMLGMKQSYNVAVAFGMAASFLLYCHRVSQGSRRILPST
jgi:23S rRNA (guanosine2251-2'-O)-methyltransferase